MQKLNPGVEAPLSKILDHLRSNCEELDARRKDNKLTAVFQNIPNSDQQKLVMTMRTDLVGLPFVWKFVAHPADNNMVSLYSLILKISISHAVFKCLSLHIMYIYSPPPRSSVWAVHNILLFKQCFSETFFSVLFLGLLLHAFELSKYVCAQ